MKFSLIDESHEIEFNDLSLEDLSTECATTFDAEIIDDMAVGDSFNIGTSVITRVE